ncbi:TPA: type II toxin-antitoxin system HicA family toxin [Citrobacter amalonaticus]
MSKQQKLRERLNSIPKNYTWDELVTLLNNYGFSMLNGSGSRRKFVNASNRVISIHCPHPGSIVKQYALKNVKLVLDELDNL